MRSSTKLRRIIFVGISNIIRAPFVSFSAIFVMTIMLFVVGFAVLLGQVTNDVVGTLRDKVDLTVYFVSNTPEEQIIAFRDTAESHPTVSRVVYVSQDSALEEYKKRHESNPQLLQGLLLLEENPLRARFSIEAEDTGDLEGIAKFLQNEDVLSDNPTTIIDKIDFYQNREIIARLTSVIDSTTLFVQGVIVLFVFIAFLIVFNIIRLVIYLSKDEISVMQLIGATDFYIRTPFLISGGLYGFIGAIFALLFLYPVSLWISPVVERLFENQTGLDSYYVSEITLLTIVVLLLGIIVGVVS